MFSKINDIKRLNDTYEGQYTTLNDRGYAKNNVNVAMYLPGLSQNIQLLWQLIDHKHIVSIPELLRCYTIIMVNFN